VGETTERRENGATIMALRGVKPKAIEKRLKALFFGPSGVGKTTAAIQFPRPYLIDTERGAENDQYVKLLDERGGAVFQTTDFDEMVKEVTSLLTEQHEYRTLIIDPLTTVYNDLTEKAAKKVGTEFGRHFGEANRQMKHLMNLLLRLDLNVIITSHSKPEYGDNLVVLGQTFDCYKKLDYLLDLVFFVHRRGKERVGMVKKTRIEAFPEGEVFPFCYAEVAQRYGRDVLERQAKSEALATAEQVAELKRLVELLKTPPETVEKWLDKAQAENFAELPADAAAKCIDHLAKQIKGQAA
jgi:DNA polymerase III delta prime subunit